MNTPQATPSVYHPPGRHYEVNGRRLWVESEGSGEAVLVLSGFGPAGSHAVFHPFFTRLAADRRVLYVDLYGRGRSDVPTDLTEITFAQDVADVAALVEALDAGPVHVYGFSYGGLIGQALALDHTPLVRSLVLANSLHSPEMWQANHANINREIENQLPDTWAEILRLRGEGVRATQSPLRELLGSASRLVRFFDPDNAASVTNEPGSRNVELYPLFVGADVDFIIGGEVARIPDFRPRLKELSVPVLVLAGRYDRALYPALQYEFVRHAPQIDFRVMERSGSYIHVEEPDLLHTVLSDFWKQSASAEASGDGR